MSNYGGAALAALTVQRWAARAYEGNVRHVLGEACGAWAIGDLEAGDMTADDYLGIDADDEREMYGPRVAELMRASVDRAYWKRFGYTAGALSVELMLAELRQ